MREGYAKMRSLAFRNKKEEEGKSEKCCKKVKHQTCIMVRLQEEHDPLLY